MGGVVVKVLYFAEATATGGREGRVRSSDGALSVDLAIPKELGGPGGVASNPEQLFAAGYAACFENAFRLAARRKRIRPGDTSVTARVGIGPDDAGGFGLSVELHVRASDLGTAQTEEVATDAERVCPYSNAVRGNIDVKIIIDPQPEVV
jgi:osmotically inducible protein OsmC